MDNLVLVGFSCSGKTTVGRTLSRRLRLRFVDTDRLVEQVAGVTIPEMFREQGETAFRKIERETIADVASRRFQVISTGGGAYIDADSREALRQGNLVVFLRVRPETVVRRLRNSRGGRPRPLLDAPDPLQRVAELLAEREGTYSQADVTVDVDDSTTNIVAETIVRHWFTWRKERPRRNPVAPAASASQ